MSRVLVTGARGFIGRHALAALPAAGHRVRRFQRPPRTARRCHVAQRRPVGPQRRPRARGRDRARAAHAPGLVCRAWPLLERTRERAPGRGHARAAAAGATHPLLAGSCADYDWAHALLIERETPLAPATLHGAAKHAPTSSQRRGRARSGCRSHGVGSSTCIGPARIPNGSSRRRGRCWAGRKPRSRAARRCATS